MKKKLITLMLMLCMVAVPLTGCTLPGIGDIGAEKDDDDDDKDDDKDSSATKIKLSEDEVTITEGDSFEVTVKNADDLKKLSVESDDEDLVEAELDDDTIILTAGEVSKNKETTVIVSAKGCDDREISVTIIDLDDDSDSDSSDSHDSDAGPVSTLPDDVIPDDSDDSKPSSSSDTGAYSEVAGTYSGYIYFSEDAERDFYENNLGLSYDLACDMAASGSFSVKTVATLTSSGDVSLKMDMNALVDSMCYAIEDNFVAFYREVMDDDSSSDSAILAEKDEMMDEFKAELITLYGYGDSSSDSLTTTNEGTYTYSDGYIVLDNGTTWEYDDESPRCIILDTSELGVAGTDTVYLFEE